MAIRGCGGVEDGDGAAPMGDAVAAAVATASEEKK